MRQWGTNGTVHPDDLPHVGQVFGPAIATGSPYDFDARIRRFDGVYRWCQVRGLPLRDSSGGITRWYVVLTDIDDRKRAEHALRGSERNLKLIVDTIPALAWSARPMEAPSSSTSTIWTSSAFPPNRRAVGVDRCGPSRGSERAGLRVATHHGVRSAREKPKRGCGGSDGNIVGSSSARIRCVTKPVSSSSGTASTRTSMIARG